MLSTVDNILLHNFFRQYIIMLDVDCNTSTVRVRIPNLTNVIIIPENKIYYFLSTPEKKQVEMPKLNPNGKGPVSELNPKTNIRNWTEWRPNDR